jgi:hypothetical protein
MCGSTPEGRIEYVAASPFEVEPEMKKFFHELKALFSLTKSLHKTAHLILPQCPKSTHPQDKKWTTFNGFLSIVRKLANKK